MTERKIPMRKCMGCGEMKDKRTLVRVVRSKEGEISLDLSGKKPGRGAYVCKSAACLSKAQKRKSIERALSCTIDDAVYTAMKAEISDA